jgi:hypothetical protein
MEQYLHIVAFLKKHPKITLYMSPELPRIDYGDFQTKREDFAEIHRDANELLPHRMPIPRGRRVVTTAFVDTSHAANKVTRRSHTGYDVFINRAPIVWYSNRQHTVENSTCTAHFFVPSFCTTFPSVVRFSVLLLHRLEHTKQ